MAGAPTRSNLSVAGTETQRLLPGELQPGDLVYVGAEEPGLVLDEPLAVHRGLGIFDEFRILVGTRLQFEGAARVVFWTWEQTELLNVQRHSTWHVMRTAATLSDPRDS